jgi:hypothetical protein
MVRVDDIALVDQPANTSRPRRIDCYRVEREKTFKLDLARVLFSLRYQHNAVPPDFELFLFRDPGQWFELVTALLLGELSHRQPHLFDKLRAAT